MQRTTIPLLLASCLLLAPFAAVEADVGDPQIRTDHPFYPGELAISTFDRLFQTQAEVYERATGRRVDSDEQKALASWYWRNTHYWHGEAGKRDLWGEGFQRGRDMRLREYWNGLFGYGFGLCGTTHSQWTAEMEQLLGHGRGRGVGAAGHNSFEVYLTGGAYGDGRWALLDHDLSTVVYDTSGERLLGLGEMQQDIDRWIKRDPQAAKQNGWLVCGLHPADGESFRKYAVAEYLAGYAGPPPMIHLRRGERFRRYFQPGLEDGKTFVFWGRNYNTDGIAGPERSRTWVNQPEEMFRSQTGTPHRNGQARYANAVYHYRPNFQSGDYREAVVEESEDHVVFEFQTPYVIGATPPDNSTWGIYQTGCRNGLVVRGQANCQVRVSLNAGRTWSKPGRLESQLDLTDLVKGRSQYWLRFEMGASQLADAELEIRTVCQANVAVLPRLKDGMTTISYEASGQRVVSLGPEIDLARTFIGKGDFGEKSVSLTATPRRSVTQVYAAAHAASGSPPDSRVRYQIEAKVAGDDWRPIVAEWSVPRRGDEPKDYWSQSFCYGATPLPVDAGKPIEIRFRNDGGKRFLRAEAHLVQQVRRQDPVRITYRWTHAKGIGQQSHVFSSQNRGDWRLATGKGVRTRWVEFEPVVP